MNGLNTQAQGTSPKTWKDYESLVKQAQATSGKFTKEAKDTAIRNTVLGMDGQPSLPGLHKVGQQFIGPILVRLKYEGVTRDLLLEKTIAQGQLPIFPVWDHIGYAFLLNDYSGEVQAVRMEAKLFQVPLVRIAARVIIPKAEVYAMNFDLVERAKQQMLENIMRREDRRYYTLLDLAISGYATEQLGPEYYNYPDPSEYSINVVGDFTHMSFADSFRVISQAQLMPSKILLNVGDYMDIFNWGVNTLSYAAVERLVDTGVLPRYGMADFKPSVTVPKGVSYVQPDPQYVGFFPQRWSVQVQEYHDPAKGEYGWVMDEGVGYAIMNPRGLVRLQKTA